MRHSLIELINCWDIRMILDILRIFSKDSRFPQDFGNPEDFLIRSSLKSEGF